MENKVKKYNDEIEELKENIFEIGYKRWMLGSQQRLRDGLFLYIVGEKWQTIEDERWATTNVWWIVFSSLRRKVQ